MSLQDGTSPYDLDHLFLFGTAYDGLIVNRDAVVGDGARSPSAVRREFLAPVLTWAVFEESYSTVRHEAVDCIVLVTASTVVSYEPLIPVPINGLYGFAYPVEHPVNGYRLRLVIAGHKVGHVKYALGIRGFATAESYPVPFLLGIGTAVDISLVHPNQSLGIRRPLSET